MSKALKLQRIKDTLAHKCPDQIPVGEFYWTLFNRRCKALWGDNFDGVKFFDLDYVVVNPNMDPLIRSFEVLLQEEEDIIVKTGFGATIKRTGDIIMPHFESFEYDTFEKMEALEFDAPNDPRRFFEGGDDQINCVGDTLGRNIPSWSDRVDTYVEEYPIFGSVCEVYELLWRIIGTENSMYWMVEDPERYQAIVDKVGDFIYKLCEAEIEAGKGRLSGMYIWGDVAYKNGMLFNPNTWRKMFKPHIKRLIELCHKNGLVVVYHGCGNATPIYEDMIEIGLDGYNPLEAKAGLDVVELNKTYGGRLGFVGNINMQILESGNKHKIEYEVLYKMQAAQKGGWICQSDHSVSHYVDPEDYKFMVELVRKWGKYPIDRAAIEKRLAVLKTLIQ